MPEMQQASLSCCGVYHNRKAGQKIGQRHTKQMVSLLSSPPRAARGIRFLGLVDKGRKGQHYSRPSKSKFFCAVRIFVIKFCAKTFAKNSINTGKFCKKFLRFCAKHENSAYFPSFAVKHLNFMQILEHFAQTCVCMSAAFRSSAVQQSQCSLAEKYQGTEPAHADSEQEHVKNSDTDNAVPSMEKPRAPGMMETPSFGIKASTDHFRSPVCGNQHAYTGNKGLIKLSTRLIDFEMGYGSKTEE